MTTTHDPALLRARTTEMATLLLAAGLDRATLFRQSQVPAHAELAYLLECTAHTGELNRMIQFKEKGRGVDSTRVSLYTYPALMAADILLYRPDRGAGRRRPAPARRAHPRPGAALQPDVRPGVHRPRDRDPAGRRAGDGPGRPDPEDEQVGGRGRVVFLLDPPDVVRRKVARAVTDSDTGPDAVRRDREAKPGVTNLLEILEACGGSADGLTTYGALKAAVTDAVVAVLEPLQKRYADLAADPTYVTQVYRPRRRALPPGDRAGPRRRPSRDGPGLTRVV